MLTLVFTLIVTSFYEVDIYKPLAAQDLEYNENKMRVRISFSRHISQEYVMRSIGFSIWLTPHNESLHTI
jgi:hypothetical protein